MPTGNDTGRHQDGEEDVDRRLYPSEPFLGERARDNGKKEQEIKDSLGVKRRNRVLWPTLFSNNTLGEGNNLKRVIKGKVGFQNAPVTQCYYPKVDSTIKHHKKLGSVYQTGTFRQMEVLESLYEPRSKTSSS